MKQPKVGRFLLTEEGRRLEKKFTEASRRRGALRKRSFSLHRFMSLCAKNLFLKEIAQKLHVSQAQANSCYNTYCYRSTLFGKESSRQRAKRIFAHRTEQACSVLSEDVSYPSVIQEQISALATKLGCSVQPVIIVGHGRPPYVSARKLIINGCLCYIQLITSACRDRDGSRPITQVTINLNGISGSDFVLICLRISGYGARNYVVPTQTLTEYLQSQGVQKKTLYVIMGRAKKKSDSLDIRPFHNHFKAIEPPEKS